MTINDFKLELEWQNKYCPNNKMGYYEIMIELLKEIMGGGLFPVIELDSPSYYGCDGTARCDAFFFDNGKCMFIDKLFNGEKIRGLSFLPFNCLCECMNKLIEMKYHFI